MFGPFAVTLATAPSPSLPTVLENRPHSPSGDFPDQTTSGDPEAPIATAVRKLSVYSLGEMRMGSPQAWPSCRASQTESLSFW